MNIPVKTIASTHIEDNSKTLFNPCGESFVLQKGEGRHITLNKTAEATRGFAVITYNSTSSFHSASGKKDEEFE